MDKQSVTHLNVNIQNKYKQFMRYLFTYFIIISFYLLDNRSSNK